MEYRILFLKNPTNSDADCAPMPLMLEHCVVSEVHSTIEARATVETGHVDCVLVDGSIPHAEPLEILEWLTAGTSDVPVIFRGSEITARVAIQLMRAGACDCFDTNESVSSVEDRILAAAADHRAAENARIAARDSSEPWRAFLVGHSDAMEAVAETIRLVGPRRCTVLINGDTGTGKEMAARALHMAGPRGRHHFVAINCSALPENLLEAELFGHVRGAFTGAMNQRVGRFEQANKGTLFLDEIGDMPLDLQAKLLRVLQEREIQRLGSSDTIKVDVRVIAATNVDLQERIRQGKFREDLYYRLNVVPLSMPALRKRTSDIPALVRHFVARVCEMEDIPLKTLAPETMNRLCGSPWPGNVRQLENAVEMAIAVSGDRTVLQPKDFGLTACAPMPPASETRSSTQTLEIPEAIDFSKAVSQFELAMLNQALRQSNGNKTIAAVRLGIKRTTLIMKLRNFANSGMLLSEAC